MYIDTHGHFRDEEESGKETIKHALEIAERAGVDVVIDNPNTKRPVVNRERVLRRLEIADSCNSPVFYATYIGATADPRQIEEAVSLYHEFRPRVSGIKLFTVKSNECLAITKFEDQRIFYRELVKNDYRGPTKVHCEKESLMNANLFDAFNPWTHCKKD